MTLQNAKCKILSEWCRRIAKYGYCVDAKRNTVKTLNTGIRMKSDDFVGPEFFPSFLNVIKHPEYRILSIPDTGQRFFGPNC